MSKRWVEYRRFPIDRDMSEINAFLSSQNIAHIFTEEGAEQVLWMSDQSQVAFVDDFLDKYFRGEIQMRRTAKLDVLKRPDLLEFAAAAPVTTILLLLGFIGYIIGDVVQSSEIFKHLAYLPISYLLKNFEFWRLITPVFVHFSIAHFVLNAIWLFILGRGLENYLGTKHYIYLFLATAIFGNVAQFSASYSNLFGGLSGVVYGLLGFLTVGKFLFKEKLLQVPTNLIVICLISMAMGFLGVLDWMTSGGIANWAHLGGFVGGCVYAIGYFLKYKQVKL